MEETRDYVGANLLTSVGIAIVVGYLHSRLLRTRQQEPDGASDFASATFLGPYLRAVRTADGTQRTSHIGSMPKK